MGLTRILLVAGLLTGLGGCAPDLTALANDPAPACFKWQWIYGSGELSRYHGCDPVKP